MEKPKVLVVEDDEVIARYRKMACFQNWVLRSAAQAGTGADALECAAKLQPDIVLMDISLNGDMDGIETAGQIKKNFNIPVIFVTAHIHGEILARAKTVNPDGFIKKPFDDDDLRIAIELGLKK